MQGKISSPCLSCSRGNLSRICRAIMMCSPALLHEDVSSQIFRAIMQYSQALLRNLQLNCREVDYVRSTATLDRQGNQKVVYEHANFRSRIRPGVTVTAAYSFEASEVNDTNVSMRSLSARISSHFRDKLASMLTHGYKYTFCAKLYPKPHGHSCVCLHKIFL